LAIRFPIDWISLNEFLEATALMIDVRRRLYV
jgi:hypothetical protein